MLNEENEWLSWESLKEEFGASSSPGKGGVDEGKNSQSKNPMEEIAKSSQAKNILEQSGKEMPIYNMWVSTSENMKIYTNVIKLLEKGYPLLLSGQPCSGKTTLMRELSNF